MRILLAATAAVALLAGPLGTPAAAATQSHRSKSLAAYLTGAQEVPADSGDPDATGIALFSLKPNGKLCYVIHVRKVDGDVNGAHIHVGLPGEEGTVRVTLAAPVWSGSVAACTKIGLQLASRLWRNPARFYVNVHSTTYPDGAVRGQLHRAS